MVERRPPETTGLESIYTIEKSVYPPDLAWMKDRQNYVVFYINVPEPLSGSTANTDLMDIDDPIPGSTQGPVSFGIKNRTYKRIKDVVVLPIMSRPVAHYSADFDTTALGPVVGWALTNGTASSTTNQLNKAFLGAAGDSWGTFGGVMGDYVKAMAAGAVNAILPDFLDGQSSTVDIFSTITKQAFNQHQNQIFRNMRFRDFSFEYRFVPRDATESNIIKKIIQTFKYHMHPDNAKGNVFLTYPSEFEIVFYNKKDENAAEDTDRQNLFKMSTSVLTDFQVAYGPDRFVTFDDGMPTEINMRLQFAELELLTKERIKQGF